MLLIIIRELAKVSWVVIIPELSKSSNLFLLYFFSLQLIFAIVQGSLSDHFCRKKSLIICFAAISIGQIFLFGALKWSWLLWIGLGIDGCLGNVPPIARAALVETGFLNNPKKALGLSFAVLAPPWIMSIFLPQVQATYLILTVFGLLILGLFLTICLFKDERDLDPHRHLSMLKSTTYNYKGIKKIAPFFKWLSGFAKTELKGIFKAFLLRAVFLIYISFIISQTAYEIIFYYLDFVNIREEEAIIILIMLIAFMIGSLTQVFTKCNQGKAILLGYALSALSIPVGYFVSFLPLPPFLMKIALYGPITFAAGFYIPAIYSWVSLKYQAHHRGKVLGILDSIQTLGDMLGAFVLSIWQLKNFFYEEVPSAIFFVVAFYLFYRTFKMKKSSQS